MYNVWQKVYNKLKRVEVTKDEHDDRRYNNTKIEPEPAKAVPDTHRKETI